MAVALGTVVQQLEESGIVALGKLEDFVPPKAHPKDVEELVRELVKQNHLTKFQAQQIAQGRTKALILGGYTILDKIGAGSMGQVFKAEHRRMKRIVAIKTLPPSTMNDERAVARFQREVEAAAKLRHTHIVAADDADEANGVHFLVMEFVDGQDLAAIVKKQGPLPVDKAVNYVLQAARGLEFAHRKGVVHRDIKPSNLLLDLEGTVKILDMGLARIASDGNTATQAELTGLGTVMGTVDYMSPEQARSTKNADGRADIYSLGCSLYYLLAGQPTYEGETITTKLLAHQSEPIPELRQVRPEVTAELEAIFEKMIAKKVEDRYQTVGEVIAELERCVGGQATSVSLAPAASTNVESGVLSFLDNRPAPPTIAPTQKQQSSPALPKAKAGRATSGNKKLILSGAIGAAVLGVAIVGAIIVLLPTREGTLTVEVDQPDAVVKVLDAEGTVELSQKSGSGKVSISVDPGKHRLKVEKDGFTIFGQDFEIASGGKKTITAKLEPAKVVAAVPKGGAKRWETPVFQKWMKDVAAMAAEKQVDAVAKKLQELNPGFDGKLGGTQGQAQPTIKNDVVTGVTFATKDVTDISPLRALSGLEWLACGNGNLADLSPLAGLQLTSLECGHTQVSDLAPLREMPLTQLYCSATPVADLSPLQGMPLKSLDIGGTKVMDLTPVKGLPLEGLTLSYTQISDLAPLKGMPLTSLQCSSTPVADLSPLKGMSLVELFFSQTKVADLSPLRGMPLAHLYFFWTPVSNLSPLQGMPLTNLSCAGTNVDDLSPLKDMPLTMLHCQETAVRDLSPLAGMPLSDLRCARTPVFDLSPLAGMKLANFSFTPQNITQGIEAIRKMGSVTNIALSDEPKDQFPAAEFWAKYDAGGFVKTMKNPAFQQWMKDVAAMPGEKQVEAVSKKLVELNPGFDGKVTGWHEIGAPKIENGVVTEFGFHTDSVADISPVRALAGLKKLACNGSYTQQRWGLLTDLSPLRGLPLTMLVCGTNSLFDLSPLQGMRLTSLHCNTTAVADLSPLRGMPLTELNCSHSRVSDLSPLQEAKNLTSVRAEDTKVTPAGVAALQKALPNCKIEWDDPSKSTLSQPPAKVDPDRRAAGWALSVGGSTKVSVNRQERPIKAVGDIPVESFQVIVVNLEKTKVKDAELEQISALTKVEWVNLLGTQISDAGMQHLVNLASLKDLWLLGTNVTDAGLKDVSKLNGLRFLGLNSTQVSDAGLPEIATMTNLKGLDLRKTKVTPAGVAALQKALPNCKIDWDDPAKAKPPENKAPDTK